MRKQVFGRQLKRDQNERKALFKSLMSALVLNERIKTTEEKAKSIKGQVEKLVTKAKKRGAEVKNEIQVYLTSDAITKLVNDVAPRFKEVNGGYTRIIKIGNRLKDNANMAIIEWTAQGQALIVPQELKKGNKRAQKKVSKEGKVSPIRQAQGKQVSKVESSKGRKSSKSK